MKSWLFRLVGVLIFIVVLARIDLKVVSHQIVLIGWYPWVYTLALTAVSIAAKTWRWQALVRGIARYPFRQALISFASGALLAMVTPGRVGDLMRVQFAKEDTGGPGGALLGSVILDRLYDLGLLAVVGGWGLTTLALGPRLTVLFFFVTAFLVALGWVCTRTPLPGRLFDRLARRLPEKYAGMVAGGSEAFTGYFRGVTWRQHLMAGLCTALAYAVIFFQLWDLGTRMGIGLSWSQVCYFVAIVNIVTIVPISIAGVGTRDLLYILIFARLGLSRESAVAFATVHFLVGSVLAIGFGVVCWQLRARAYAKEPVVQ